VVPRLRQLRGIALWNDFLLMQHGEENGEIERRTNLREEKSGVEERLSEKLKLRWRDYRTATSLHLQIVAYKADFERAIPHSVNTQK
jgi:hypothetical protein